MTQAVLMYTTAVCPYCIRAKQLLAARGVFDLILDDFCGGASGVIFTGA